MKQVWSPGARKYITAVSSDVGLAPLMTDSGGFARRTIKSTRTVEPSPKRKRVKSWAKMSHRQGITLAKQVRSPAFAVLFVLDQLAFETHSNPVRLSNEAMKRFGFSRVIKRRGLAHLLEAKMISVEPDGKRALKVTLKWRPKGRTD
jgi:hypothetical protein